MKLYNVERAYVNKKTGTLDPNWWPEIYEFSALESMMGPEGPWLSEAQQESLEIYIVWRYLDEEGA